MVKQQNETLRVERSVSGVYKPNSVIDSYLSGAIVANSL